MLRMAVVRLLSDTPARLLHVSSHHGTASLQGICLWYAYGVLPLSFRLDLRPLLRRPVDAGRWDGELREDGDGETRDEVLSLDVDVGVSQFRGP